MPSSRFPGGAAAQKGPEARRQKRPSPVLGAISFPPRVPTELTAVCSHDTVIGAFRGYFDVVQKKETLPRSKDDSARDSRKTRGRHLRVTRLKRPKRGPEGQLKRGSAAERAPASRRLFRKQSWSPFGTRECRNVGRPSNSRSPGRRPSGSGQGASHVEWGTGRPAGPRAPGEGAQRERGEEKAP